MGGETPDADITTGAPRHFPSAGDGRPEVPKEDNDPPRVVDQGATPQAAPPPAANKPAANTGGASAKTGGGAIPFPSPAAEPPPPAADAAAAAPEEPTPFLALLESLYASAMIQLGASAPGEISRPEPDFAAARQTIEIMGVLQNKTRGNLTPGEARALEEMLYELRLYYVQLTRARGQK